MQRVNYRGGVTVMLVPVAKATKTGSNGMHTRDNKKVPNWTSERTQRLWQLLKHAGSSLGKSLDPLSKAAQIVAVVIAGYWTYHIYLITGAEDFAPEVWVSTQAVPYSKDARLLNVHIREKNVGKVPVTIGRDDLTLRVKKVPDSLPSGFVNMDGQPALFEERHLLRRYDDGLYISPGTEAEDVAQFVVVPGMYTVEANFLLSDGDNVSDIAFQRVD
jgi:hypothetical protein